MTSKIHASSPDNNSAAMIPVLSNHPLPPIFLETLLPSPSLSVLDFLKFRLPVVSKALSTVGIRHLFSNDPPTTEDPTIIRGLPVPHAQVVQQLLEAINAPGFQKHGSIRLSHAPGHGDLRLPLWVVTYWAEIVLLQGEDGARGRWLRAEEWVHKRREVSSPKFPKKTHQLVNEVLGVLSSLPWTGNLSGFSNREPIETLSRYLSRNWFSDIHQNQMLDFLRTTVMRRPEGLVTDIENTYIWKALNTAFEQRDDPEFYQRDRRCARPRHVGAMLATGERHQCAMLINLTNTHWVAVVIDFKNSTILYGDSLSRRPDAHVVEVLNWWTSRHASGPLAWDVLPITRQTDEHSCGILSWQALAHHLIPDEHPLSGASLRETDCLRMAMLVDIAQRHLDNSFDVVSTAYEFTFTYSHLAASESADHRMQSPPSEHAPDQAVSSFSKPVVDSQLHDKYFEHAFSPSSSIVSLPASESLIPPSSSAISLASSSLRSRSHASVRTSSSCSGISYIQTDSIESLAVSSGAMEVDKQNTPANPSPAPVQLPASKRASSKLSAPSSVRRALEKAAKGTKAGIMKWFGEKATPEQYAAQHRRASTQSKDFLERHADYDAKIGVAANKERKESQNERQQRFRDKKKREEIERGERDSTGRKVRPQKRLSDVLVDLAPAAKRPRKEQAEASRPKRQIAASIQEATKHAQGRKRVHERRPATYINWHGPHVWPKIKQAALHPSVGKEMSVRKIREVLVQWDEDTYGLLSPSTIDGWIDRSGPTPRWSDKALEMERRGHTQGGHGGRRGVLAPYPDAVAAIKERLEGLRAVGTPLTLVTIRGIVTATLLRKAPAVFEKLARDGSKFRCSDSFLRSFLHETLHWSERHGTREAHKLPKDWEAQCRNATLRLVHDIKEYDIPSTLFVNTDQTNIVYAQGTKLTWAPTGSKQVSIVGKTEKRALTLCVSVSNDGKLLPFQGVYQGGTKLSTPAATAPHYDEATDVGMTFEYGTQTSYWSNQRTMRALVDDIIAPYFEKMKLEAEPPRPPSQKSIWQIDVWSVHRSEEFRMWMRTNHPNILLHFVPGGCTPVLQACDVGIQRILKHSLKRSYHEDVVNEVLDQMDRGEETITIAKRVGILRDRSVGWMWTAYNRLNKPEIVKNAFRKCEAAGMNLSYECLTSYAAREELRQLKTTDRKLWEELTRYDHAAQDPSGGQKVAEDNVDELEGQDDSNVLVDAVIEHVLRGNAPTGTAVTASGLLATVTQAESLEEEEELEEDHEPQMSEPEELGRGKRRKVDRDLGRWNGEHFWKS